MLAIRDMILDNAFTRHIVGILQEIGLVKADAEWAEFVWRNRFDEKYRRPDYDIIIGPIADLGLKREFIRMRTEGLSFADVASRIHYDKYNSLQVSFCTPYSLTILNKV